MTGHETAPATIFAEPLSNTNIAARCDPDSTFASGFQQVRGKVDYEVGAVAGYKKVDRILRAAAIDWSDENESQRILIKT